MRSSTRNWTGRSRCREAPFPTARRRCARPRTSDVVPVARDRARLVVGPHACRLACLLWHRDSDRGAGYPHEHQGGLQATCVRGGRGCALRRADADAQEEDAEGVGGGRMPELCSGLVPLPARSLMVPWPCCRRTATAKLASAAARLVYVPARGLCAALAVARARASASEKRCDATFLHADLWTGQWARWRSGPQ